MPAGAAAPAAAPLFSPPPPPPSGGPPPGGKPNGWRKLSLAAGLGGGGLFKSEVVRGRLRAVLREQPLLAARSSEEIERVVEAKTGTLTLTLTPT